MSNINIERLCRERYFTKDETSWEQLATRVSSYIANGDKLFQKDIYNVLINKDFLFNSPTLINAGTDLSQLSACFVLGIEEDSMKGIFQAIADMAVVQKCGGGTGFNFSILREKGSEVSTTKGKASGVISFLKVFNAGSKAVEQGGIRRGANMASLLIDHPGIPEFVTYKSKKNKAIDLLMKNCEYNSEEWNMLNDMKELTYFNLSIAVTDKFMELVKDYVNKGIDADWEFISRKTGKVHSTIKVSKLWNMIMKNAWESGDPGILFIDRINEFNPIPSIKIDAVNPCGEQPLHTNESCNLGSINLVNHIDENNNIDYVKLKHTVDVAVRALDAIIDRNLYPLPKIEKMTKMNRKIGLGVMGYADVLYKANLKYGSEEALKLAEEIMHFIDFMGKRMSTELAFELGSFPNIKSSIYKNTVMRNATITTIAPTGSISILANCSSGIEPNFSLAYYRTIMKTKEDGNYKILVVNPVLEEKLKELNIYSAELVDRIALNNGSLHGIKEIPNHMKEVFCTSFDVTTEEHLNTQQAFQKHTDNAISKTINMPCDASIEEVGKTYVKAYELGLKGVTVYRDGSLGVQVLNNKKDKTKEKEIVAIKVDGEYMQVEKDFAEKLLICPNCGEKTMTPSGGCSICYNCGYSPCSNS